jgi:enoyl-CoA hydratase/carnithine racemase
MADATVETRDELAVRWIRLDRPDSLNALSASRVEALLDALGATPPEARVVVLAGREEAFCAGDDLREAATLDRAGQRAYVEALHEVTRALLDLPQPAIAAIDGVAVGGGVEIAAACDLRIGTRRARIGFPDADVGMSVTNATSVLLPRLVGEAQARLLVLGGRLVSGEEAHRLGLLTVVCDDGRLEEETRRLAEAIAARPAAAVQASKRALVGAIRDDVERALSRELELVLECHDRGSVELVRRWLAARS